MSRIFAIVSAAVLCAATLAAQAADPASGTWELNVAKSRSVPAGLAPRTQTRTYQVTATGETAHHTGVDAQGRSTVIEFTATYGGPAVPYKGSPDWDSIAITRIDTYTAGFTQFSKGKAMASGTRVISKDGKTMTVTVKGKNAKGEPVDAVMVFDRR